MSDPDDATIVAAYDAKLTEALGKIGAPTDHGFEGMSALDRACAMLVQLYDGNQALQQELTSTAGERTDAVTRAEQLQADLAKAEKSRDAARARVAAGTVAPAPRALKPVAADKRLSREDLKAAIADADKVEIAFSDGKKEVRGLAPVIVSGEAWKDHAIGLMLAESVDLYGPAGGGGSYSVEGYALLLDGKQVAFTARDPLTVGAGKHVRLTDDIAF
jgi:hypothetical protein